MYLSRVELDVSRRSTMMALTSLQKFHGALEDSFDGERRRHLWRLDRLGDKLFMLVLSEERPDLNNLVNQFGTGTEAESKNYETLLRRIKNGDRWNFRLTANPTRSCKKTSDARGTVVAHKTLEFQKKWLTDRAEKNGFEVKEDEFDVTETHWHHFAKKGNHPVYFLAVTYEGVLKVTDVNKFQTLLCNGIGREKAYGLGMMTIMCGGL